MSSGELREKFLIFFKNKGHIIVPSSSLLSDDPSVLLTTAGVQQFKPYYTGLLDPKKDFGSKRVASAQKSFRTTDIDEIGDKTHLTFFEMLGNFSFGDYWKEEAIAFAYEFITKELKIKKDRLSISVFSGSGNLSPDSESYEIWKNKIGISGKKIKKGGMEDNFWGPTGGEGPCGPTTEIYIDGVEVWNIVFNEYFCKGSREELLAGKAALNKLKQPGIDTGMGLERLAVVINGFDDIYKADTLENLVELTPNNLAENVRRIIADHIRGAAFLISDGVRPSNKEAGYVLRRLIRRIITHVPDFNAEPFFASVNSFYAGFYDIADKKILLDIFNKESGKFSRTLNKGLNELKKLKSVTGAAAFALYETFGLPFEVIKEFGGSRAKGLTRRAFDEEFQKHKEVSRAGQEKKFGGHGLVMDTGELKAGSVEEVKKVTRLHTATHLLQQALRDVLGGGIRQMGSDITAERTRFDFSFDRKLTQDEIKKIEEIVNGKIKENLSVAFKELPLEEAKKTGALYYFKEKYPAMVKVYYVGKNLDDAYSKEFCGGPHVSQTGEIGKFKIIKEEGVGAGVRRIKGAVI